MRYRLALFKEAKSCKRNFKLLWKYWSFFPYHKTLLQILYFLSFGLLTNCAKHLHYYLLRSKADLCWPRENFQLFFCNIAICFLFFFYYGNTKILITKVKAGFGQKCIFIITFLSEFLKIKVRNQINFK